MEDQFVPYELALKLKNIGFDEKCLGVYVDGIYYPRYTSINSSYKPYPNECKDDYCTAPLWQQAFTFLLRKLKNRELCAVLEFDGEVTLMEVVTDDSYGIYNKILASGNKESLEKLIELCKKV